MSPGLVIVAPRRGSVQTLGALSFAGMSGLCPLFYPVLFCCQSVPLAPNPGSCAPESGCTPPPPAPTQGAQEEVLVSFLAHVHLVPLHSCSRCPLLLLIPSVRPSVLPPSLLRWAGLVTWAREESLPGTQLRVTTGSGAGSVAGILERSLNSMAAAGRTGTFSPLSRPVLLGDRPLCTLT